MANNRTDGEIAKLAEGLRRFAGQANTEILDVSDLIERLSRAPPNLQMSVIPALDNTLPYAAAEAEPKRRLIRVRHSTLMALKQNDPEAKAIILEEIGHVLISHDGVRNHFLAVDFRARSDPQVEIEEEEARKFVWYCLTPFDDAVFVKSAHDFVTKYGFTQEHATAYFHHVQEHLRRISKTRRPLPSFAVDYLNDAAVRGHQITSIPQPAPTPVRTRKKPISQVSRDPEKEIAYLMKYEAVPCPTCGKKKLRRTANCCQCQECGSSTGC